MTGTAASRHESGTAIDNEHLVQIELVDAVVDAVDRDAPTEKVRELLEHFIQFTELHFMSEGLLMRLHAYPDYDEHVNDHDRIIDRVHDLRSKIDDDSSAFDKESAIRLKGEILSHIRNRDAALHVYIAHLKH